MMRLHPRPHARANPQIMADAMSIISCNISNSLLHLRTSQLALWHNASARNGCLGLACAAVQAAGAAGDVPGHQRRFHKPRRAHVSGRDDPGRHAILHAALASAAAFKLHILLEQSHPLLPVGL